MLFAGDAVYDGELVDHFERSHVDDCCLTMERLSDEYLLGRRGPGCPLA